MAHQSNVLAAMQYMIPYEIETPTPETAVAAQMSRATREYRSPRLRLLRESEVIHPARARNTQLIEMRQIPCRGPSVNHGALMPYRWVKSYMT